MILDATSAAAEVKPHMVSQATQVAATTAAVATAVAATFPVAVPVYKSLAAGFVDRPKPNETGSRAG